MNFKISQLLIGETQWVSHSEVLLLSDASIYKYNLENMSKNILNPLPDNKF